MTGQQRAVLWIGLILVGLNMVAHWSDIRSVIFTGAGITSGIPGGGGISGGDSGSGGLGGIIGRAGKKALGGIVPGGSGLLSTNPQNTKDVTLV